MATWLPATEKTLSTAELLESILLQLDLQTLLTSAQRTCRTWTNLIRGSPALQRALYFTPVSDTRGHEAVLNPLLIDTFPSFFEVENETLFGGGNGTLLASLRMFKQPETQASFLREEASWRRMLVQQPPVFKIARWHCSVGQFGVYLYREIPENPRKTQNGLRMETLFEEIFFDPEPEFGYFESIGVTWWKRYTHDVSSVQCLETLGNFKVDTDILISSCSSSGCLTPAILCEQGPPLDVHLKSKVWSGYRKLGLRPKCRKDKGWLGTVQQFDFEIGLDFDD